MHPCLENWVAIGHVNARSTHAFVHGLNVGTALVRNSCESLSLIQCVFANVCIQPVVQHISDTKQAVH